MVKFFKNYLLMYFLNKINFFLSQNDYFDKMICYLIIIILIILKSFQLKF